jgi:hypothetical protein
MSFTHETFYFGVAVSLMRFYAEVMEDVSKQAEIRKNCFLLFPPELNQVLTSADVSLSLKHGSNHSCKARGQDLS